MLVHLIWCGQRIPTVSPETAFEAIGAFGLDQKAVENLEALWSAADAIVDNDAFVDRLFWSCWEVSDPVLKMAALIDDGVFQETLKEDRDFDWSALPDWVRQNADKLKIIPA